MKRITPISRLLFVLMVVSALKPLLADSGQSLAALLSNSSTDQSELLPYRFPQADDGDSKAYRDDRTVYYQVDASIQKLTMPRLAAPLYTVSWLGKEGSPGVLKLHPEQETWIVSWKNRPSGATVLAVKLGAAPKLPQEIEAIQPSGDGSFWIPGHLGVTEGEKIRYEPQTFKNTVGYWVGKNDNVSWTIDVALPGKFNVGILQGCGKGQGGSLAELSCANEQGSSSSLEFTVAETGHFQDFQWRHLGVLEIKDSGKLTLNIRPKKIAKNALMDVRMLVLTPLPGGKR